jgi:hypothetical protein
MIVIAYPVPSDIVPNLFLDHLYDLKDIDDKFRNHLIWRLYKVDPKFFI